MDGEEGGREGELLHDCSCHQFDTKTLHTKDNTGCTTHLDVNLWETKIETGAKVPREIL